jgi:hypothetical protein
MNKLPIICILAAIILIFSCVKPVVKQQETVREGHDVLRSERGDTVGYLVSFHDTSDRKRFTLSFERFLDSYPFHRDTLVQNRYFRLDFVSAQRPVEILKPVPQETLARKEAEALPQPAQAAKLRTGGAITLYTQRGFLDHDMSGLVQCCAFGADVCHAAKEGESAGYLQVKSASDKQIIVTLAAGTVSATGKILSSLDLIDAWTGYAKKHPAEGLALFRNVKGFAGFIRGREAVIGGLVALDDKTIAINFDGADPAGFVRLCSRRLMPESLKLGPYFSKSDNGQLVVLSANQHFPGIKPNLSSCAVRLGKDATPIVSFSLNRYDAVELVFSRDIDLARRKAPEQSVLLPFSQDRYFLSCGLDNPGARAALRNALNARDILASYVKAEGAPLSVIESDAPPASPTSAENGQTPVSQPVSVLFRSDDPVSAIVAEKVVADLTRSGNTASLRPATQEEYETALSRHDFQCAVGWAPQDILVDESEKVRLRTMWFGDAADETARIADNREIPLFSVKGYLLCKKKVSFSGPSMAGIFLAE